VKICQLVEFWPPFHQISQLIEVKFQKSGIFEFIKQIHSLWITRANCTCKIKTLFKNPPRAKTITWTWLSFSGVNCTDPPRPPANSFLKFKNWDGSQIPIGQVHTTYDPVISWDFQLNLATLRLKRNPRPKRVFSFQCKLNF